MELGLYSFGEFTAAPDPLDPAPVNARLHGLVASAVLAEEAGLDVFGLGEHHRRDMAVSAGEIVLAAIAARTQRLRLTSAVTVLSSQDPVRVFQQFATLDQLSDGRAEIIAGRGAFIESFPLFGYRLEDYDLLFEEKIQLLLQLRDQPRITWQGRTRPGLRDAEISPQPVQRPLPIWIGAGGTPTSFVRAGVLGMPLSTGGFGDPRQLAPLVGLYRQAFTEAGHDPAGMRVASGGHMYIGRTSQAARNDFYPYYAGYWNAMGRFPNGFSRRQFDDWVDGGGIVVGSPQQAAETILTQQELYGSDRFTGQFDVGNLPTAMTTSSIKLFAGEVAPVVRRETAQRAPRTAG